MVRTEAPALGESRRQQLLPLPLSTAPAPDPPGSQESELIAPATASFPWGLYGVTSLNRVVHQVNSYVDAQNSFGAKVRTYFSCEVPGFGDDISRYKIRKFLIR